MQDPDFKFKQFSIWHDKCAMKVNTDGILLAAWTELMSCNNILDIGTGTGLIALMLAQKSQHQTLPASLCAVEIDPAAAEQAQFNITQSKWRQQIELIQQDIQSYSQQSSRRFDLLVSNPPYFTNSLQAGTVARNQARHNQGLSFDDLLASAAKLATKQARFNLILPCNEANKLIAIAKQHNWHLVQECLVSTVTDKPASRSLLSLSKQGKESVTKSHITIRNRDNSYTTEFIELCRDYYLFM